MNFKSRSDPSRVPTSVLYTKSHIKNSFFVYFSCVIAKLLNYWQTHLHQLLQRHTFFLRYLEPFSWAKYLPNRKQHESLVVAKCKWCSRYYFLTSGCGQWQVRDYLCKQTCHLQDLVFDKQDTKIYDIQFVSNYTSLH